MLRFPRHVMTADPSKFRTGLIIYLTVLCCELVKVHRGECLLTPSVNCTLVSVFYNIGHSILNIFFSSSRFDLGGIGCPYEDAEVRSNNNFKKSLAQNFPNR